MNQYKYREVLIAVNGQLGTSNVTSCSLIPPLPTSPQYLLASVHYEPHLHASPCILSLNA